MITENELRAEYERLMRDHVGKKEIDEEALSVRELMPVLGFAYAQTGRKAAEMVEAGLWERVWKHLGTRLIPAYRPRRKNG